MEKRRISGFGTFFHKFCVPIIGLLVTVDIASFDFKLALFPLVITLIIFSITGSLKRIWIEGDDLIISNYFKTIRVPIDSISYVGENFFLSHKLIWIVFRCPTAFGQKIKFMPIIFSKDFFSCFKSHSIVEELLSLSEKKK